MRAPAHLRSAFAFRAALLGLVWLSLLAIADPRAEGLFAGIVVALARFLPLAAPVLLWLDWRWLRANPDAVNRFGFKRRGD